MPFAPEETALRIAALEDDPNRAVLLDQTLRLHGHTCVRFRAGQTLMQALRQESFDLLLLDYEIGGVAARDVLLWVRRTLGHALPVMLLSDEREDARVAACFADGADAYVHKPLRPAELAARIEALARRSLPARDSCDLVSGAFRFATADRRVWVRDQPVSLAPKEYDLAVLLFRNFGTLVLRQTMIDAVWRREMDTASRTVDSHLSRLRNKLALWPHNGVRLCSVYGVGSRLDPA